MKNMIHFLLTAVLILNPLILANAKGRIQNEDVKSLAEIQSVISITGNLSSGTNCITSPSSTTGLSTGLFIYDGTVGTRIPSGTTIAGMPGTCSAGQIQMSANAAANGTGDTITFGGQASQLINGSKIWLESIIPAQTLSSAITAGAIGGGDGSKNYMTAYTASLSGGTPNTGNGDFEQASTTGWSLSHSTLDSNTKLPNQVSGSWSGAAGTLSMAIITSGTLQKANSLSLVSSAATTAGDMLVSSPFYIDAVDQVQVMQFKFAFKVSSGATNGNFSGSILNSYGFAVYDVTNSAWIQPSNAYGVIQQGGATSVLGTFQTTSNSTQYRIAVYNMNASSGAITAVVDDFQVGPITSSQSGYVNPTVQTFGAGSGTYITPKNPVPAYIEVEECASGGGGGGSGPSGGTGGAGNPSSFGSTILSLLQGYGGGGGGGAGGTGGVGTVTTSSTVVQLYYTPGSPGGYSAYNGTGASGSYNQGGYGGGSALSPTAMNYTPLNPGTSGVGPGGGGAGGGSGTSNLDTGLGGGGGACAKVQITKPASSYAYTVGAAGAAGGAGTGGNNGGPGADGILIVREFYPANSGSFPGSNGTYASVAPKVVQYLSGSGTYTPSTNPIPTWIEIEMVGGGGGGAGGGNSGTAGGNGSTSNFGSSLLIAGAGSGGLAANGAGGTSGSNTVNSPAVALVSVQGASGGSGCSPAAVSQSCWGGQGGNSALGGGGGSPAIVSGGYAATANTGSGGGGGSGNGVAGGGGGGAGGYIKAIIQGSSLVGSYTYSVGPGGAGNSASSGGGAGGNGAAGMIVITEHFENGGAAANAAAAAAAVKYVPNIQVFTASGTYTPSSGPKPLYIKVKVAGAGGGGGSSDNTPSNGASGSAGGFTQFGGLVTAGGGNGSCGSICGGGGSAPGGAISAFNSPAISIIQASGTYGTGANNNGGSGTYTQGGAGGGNPIGVGGGGGAANAAGRIGGGYGGGGGGAGGPSTSGSSAAGGGGGAYAEFIIPGSSLASSYSLTVGAGGAAGATGAYVGGAGSGGVVIVEEHFQ